MDGKPTHPLDNPDTTETSINPGITESHRHSAYLSMLRERLNSMNKSPIDSAVLR